MASGVIQQRMSGYKALVYTGTIPEAGTAFRQTVGRGMPDAYLVDMQYFHTANNAWYGTGPADFSSSPRLQITGGNICEFRFTISNSQLAGLQFRALILTTS